jgi:hypothetical protein
VIKLGSPDHFKHCFAQMRYISPGYQFQGYQFLGLLNKMLCIMEQPNPLVQVAIPLCAIGVVLGHVPNRNQFLIANLYLSTLINHQFVLKLTLTSSKVVKLVMTTYLASEKCLENFLNHEGIRHNLHIPHGP